MQSATHAPPARQPTPAESQCPICGGRAQLLDSVDFNKSCEELRGKFLPKKGVLVDYHLCPACGFCFAPQFLAWSFEDFEREIYNADYVQVDPDYLSARPLSNAQLVEQLFGFAKGRVSHLDYGGGSGLLSQQLTQQGWKSQTYDPFVNRDTVIDDLGQFELVSAFEVFEHVPDTAKLLDHISRLVKPDGLILFSTLLSDGNISNGQPLSWWYASPRNGHISLFSAKSLRLFMKQGGFQISSASPGLHIGYRTIPAWAAPIFKYR